jgi:hypothetical protein
LFGEDAVVHAVRTPSPPLLDGHLTESAWETAPAYDSFTETFPDEGIAPSHATTVRVLYDDDNLYIGVECDDDPGGVVSRLARRDNFGVPADWVSVAIDSRLDGKDAFVFQVYPSGLLADATRFNDTDFDSSWDEVWDARASINQNGWSAEFLIPLRVLRFTDADPQTWGIQVRRNIQRLQETDVLAYVPRELNAEVSRYGHLVDLHGLHPPRDVEIAPFVVTRMALHSNLLAGDPELVYQPETTVGVNAKVGLTRNLTLDATLNPDFGEVEADQVVLNLTTFETYYPEKRPFFLEGADLFSLPIQLFYSRRIGRPPPGPAQADGAQVVSVPRVSTIYGAAKVSGRITPTLAIAALDAVTAPESAVVAAPGGLGARSAGLQQLRDAGSPQNFAIFRLRQELPYESSVGAAATAVTSFGDRPGAHGCPGDAIPGPALRCRHDAYVGSLDLTLKSPSEDYVLTGQLLGSHLVGGPTLLIPDGTGVGAGASGVAGTVSLAKNGGDHWLGQAVWTGFSPRFYLDDAGYIQQSNYQNFYEQAQYRTVQPTEHTILTHTTAQAWQDYDWGFHSLDRGGQLSSFILFSNYWGLYTELDLELNHWDNRETRDGSYFQRTGGLGGGFGLSNDSRSPIQVGGGGGAAAPFLGGYVVNGNVDVGLRAWPQLELDVIPTIGLTRERRWFETFTPTATERDYYFAFQSSGSVGATLRGTYTFTPHLTLQLYTQLFAARVAYDNFSHFLATQPGKVEIAQASLKPAAAPDDLDDDEAVLNVNIVLRWEYQLGSVLYVVYTRSQSGVPYAPQNGPAVFAPTNVVRGPAIDTFLLKLSYFWG